MKERKKVLVIAEKKSGALYKELFPASLYGACVFAENAVEAKHRLSRERFDLVLAPKLAQPKQAHVIAVVYDTYVLLFVKPQAYDQVAYQMREAKVFVLSTPVSKMVVAQVLAMLERFMDQTARLEQKVARAQKKLVEIKTIDRCKMELMHTFQWSEAKAHRYIEKSAMDTGATRAQIADQLLARMDMKRSGEA